MKPAPPFGLKPFGKDALEIAERFEKLSEDSKSIVRSALINEERIVASEKAGTAN